MNQNSTIAYIFSEQIVNPIESSSKVNDLSKPESDSFENYFTQAINQSTAQTRSTDTNQKQISNDKDQAYSNQTINATNSKETNTIDNQNKSEKTAPGSSAVIVEAPKESITIDDQGNAHIDVASLPDEVKEKLGIGDEESVEVKVVFLSKEQISALLEGKETFENINNSEDVKQKDFPAQRLFFAQYQKSDEQKSDNSESSAKIVKNESNSEQSKESEKVNKTSSKNISHQFSNNISNNIKQTTKQTNKQTENLTKPDETPLKESLVKNQKSEINVINTKTGDSSSKESTHQDSGLKHTVSNNSESKESVLHESKPNESNQSPSKDSALQETTPKDTAQTKSVLKELVIQDSTPKDSSLTDSVIKESIQDNSLQKDSTQQDSENSISKYLKSPVSETSKNDSKQLEEINDNQIQSQKENKGIENQEVIDAEKFVKASTANVANAVLNEAVIESSAAEQVIVEDKVTSEKPENSKVIYMVRSLDQSDDDAKQQKVVLITPSDNDKDEKIVTESSESSKNKQQNQKGDRNSDQDSARLIESSRISSMIKAKEERVSQSDSKDSFKKAFTSQENKTESSANNKSDAILQHNLRNNQNTSILEAVNQVKPTVQAQSNNQPDQAQMQNQQTAQTQTAIQAQPIIANTASTQQTPQATMMQQYMEKIAEVQEASAKQIVKGVQGAIGSERSHVTLRMVPESLGQIHIRITMENGQLSAQLNAEKDSTRAMMQQGLNSLRAAFDEQGLKVDRLVVNKEQFDTKQDYGKNEDSQDRAAKNRSEYGNRQNQQGNNRNGNQTKNKFALWSDRMTTSDYFV